MCHNLVGDRNDWEAIYNLKLDEFRNEDEKLILNKTQRNSLEVFGVTTVESLAMTPIRDLKKLPGMGETSILKSVRKAQEITFKDNFRTASDIHDERKKTVKFLTTGSKAFDKLLGGGIETKSITEIAGANGSGKTEMCKQLSVNVQLPENEGGLGGNALYFDTEDTFRSVRVSQMVLAKGMDVEKTLNNITVACCYTSDHQIFLVKRCDDIIASRNIKLVIVDSVMAHFRNEYIGREALGPRQQELNNHIKKLKGLAKTFDVAIVVTNQAISNPSGFGAGLIAAGGNILGHGSTTRLFLKRPRSMAPERVAELTKSPWLPSGQVAFKITGNGVEDSS